MTAVSRNSDSQSPFDSLMGEDGKWSGRDLQALMGYTEWRKFEGAIERAMITARNQGMDEHVEFSQVVKLVGAANLGEIEKKDYRLSRHAAYLVAMNGDPRKPEVAAAQNYFAVKTREAEVVQELTGAEYLLYMAQRMVDNERRAAEMEQRQKVTEAKVAAIEGAYDEFTALGYAKLNEMDTSRVHLAKLGKKATALMRDADEEPRKRQDATFGSINVYPVWALEEASETV